MGASFKKVEIIKSHLRAIAQHKDKAARILLIQ
jgi:hypothetical protein